MGFHNPLPAGDGDLDGLATGIEDHAQGHRI